MIKKFFKTVLILAFGLILFFIPVVGGIFFDYSLWNGFFVSAGMTAFFLGIRLFRALWLRWREKKFMDGIWDEGEENTGDGEASEKLAAQWKGAVSELKRSHFKQQGNPLYALPWYLVIGESGSGKTSAIGNAGLSTNFSNSPKVFGPSGTQNCDWWFFEQAIIVDTAGRYTTHGNGAVDKSEWHSFLGQLAKYRKKEPLNGLVVTVSVDTLLTSSREEIEDQGRRVRGRTEELMRVMGARFPVYLLVTKCDLIQGMKQFCDQLPESSHSQVFGNLNHNMLTDALDFFADSFLEITKKIREFRLRLSNTAGREKVSPEVLFFPEEFAKLKSGLEVFSEAAFSGNVYQESPFLRGLFFSSACQTGRPCSLGVDLKKEDLPKSHKSYFLHDLFSKILPNDRHIHVPTSRATAWKNKTRNMGAVAWSLFFVCLCGLLSFSFAANLSIIKEARNEYSRPPVLHGELVRDITVMEHFREMIQRIEERNKNRVLPGFGLNQGIQIEKELKKTYCFSFRNDFIQPYDKKMGHWVINFSTKTPPDLIGRAVPHLVRRINLLEARLKNRPLPVLSKKPQPDYRSLVVSPGEKAIPKALEILKNQYLYYLIWADDALLTQEKKNLQAWLEHAIKKKGISLRWLVEWCNENADIRSLVLGDFWSGSLELENEVAVRPAFTANGEEQIFQLLEELESALEEPLDVAKKKMAFNKWYRKSYRDEWYRFATSFPNGAKKLNGHNEKLLAAMKMGTDKNPYFALLRRMADELPLCISSEEEFPPWVKFVFELSDIRKSASTNTAVEEKGLVKKVAGKGLKLLGKMGRKAGASVREEPESVMISAEAFNRYLDGLAGISKACVSPEASFKLAATAFGEDPATGESDVFKTLKSEEELNLSMSKDLSSRKTLKTFRKLLHGPFDYLWGVVCHNAGCQVQSLWDESVLSEIEGVYDREVLNEMLFGKQGHVQKFVQGPAEPFIKRSRKKGYYAKTVAGRKIAFTGEFFAYLKRGAYTAKSGHHLYQVSLKGLPTDTNPEARVIPHVTKLELECAQGVQTLKNYNYPIRQAFQWSPEDCGNVTLTIDIGHLVLEKKYAGFRAFAQFIQAFSNGQHTFYRGDFPDQSSALKRMGVEYLKVKYEISGGAPVVKLLEMAVGKTPEVIAHCSD